MEKFFNIGITIDFNRNLYSNGLQQNVVILNNLLNKLNQFKSYFIYDGEVLNSDLVDKNLCFPHKNISSDSSINFDLIIMMGFTLREDIIYSLKSKNKTSKFVLMQCGNQFVENMSFALAENKIKISPLSNALLIDQIWILPHYKKYLSFMKTYFKNENVIIVPYIWDSLFIDHQIKNSIYKGEKTDFSLINKNSIVIMEPNIFFCKNCILPLFIVESYEQNHPKLIDSCNLLCAHKLAKNDYFIKLILQMDIYKKRKNFLKIQKRTLFIDAIHKFGSILISHQQDNALNYLYLEALYLNLPLLHNSDMISNFGYYYPENDINIAVKQLYKIQKKHNTILNDYKNNCNILIDKYSSGNIKNINKYKKLIENILDI